MDTPAGEPAAFGGVFAEFSPRHIRSKIVQDKARYRFDRQAATKPRNAGLFRLCGMLSVSRNCRISAIYMPPNAAVPTILPLFMRRGYRQLTRTHTVLTGRKTPMPLQSPCQYIKYCLRAFHCLNAFLLRQNCCAPDSDGFSCDFWFLRRRRADARQGEKDKKHRKDTLSGVCALVN